MDENIGSFFITLPENMDVQLTSDDEDYILANLDLFELQPININENELAQATESVQSTEPTENVQPDPTPNIKTVPQEDAEVAKPPEKRCKSLDETELQTLQERKFPPVQINKKPHKVGSKIIPRCVPSCGIKSNPNKNKSFYNIIHTFHHFSSSIYCECLS